MKKIYALVFGLFSLKTEPSKAMDLIAPIYTFINTSGLFQNGVATDEQKKQSLNELHKIASTGDIEAVRNYVSIIRGGYRAQQEGAKEDIIKSLDSTIHEWDNREKVTVYRLKKINGFKNKCEESLSFLSTLLEKEKQNGTSNSPSAKAIDYAREVVNNLKKNAEGIKDQIYTYTGEGSLFKRATDSTSRKINRLYKEGTIFKQEPENQYEIFWHFLTKNTPEHEEICKIDELFRPLKNLKQDDSIVLQKAQSNNKKLKPLHHKKEMTTGNSDLPKEITLINENNKKLLNEFHKTASNGDIQSVKNHIAIIRGKYRGQKMGAEEDITTSLNNIILEWNDRKKITIYKLTAINNFKTKCEESLSFLQIRREEQKKIYPSSNRPSVKCIDYAMEVVNNLKNNADGIKNQIYTYKGEGSFFERSFFSFSRKINRFCKEGTIYKKALENQYEIIWDFLPKNTPEYKEVYALDELFKPLKSLMGDDSLLLEKLRSDTQNILTFIPEQSQIEEIQQQPLEQKKEREKTNSIQIENNVITETSNQFDESVIDSQEDLSENSLEKLDKRKSFNDFLQLTTKKKNQIERLSKSLEKGDR